MSSSHSLPRPGRNFIGFIAGLAALATGLPAQTMRVADRQAAPVTIESAAISTEITGRMAVTTFDLVFRNPNGRVLEGTFEFPLLEGQSVVRFALDIGGRLREAVPVGKERGRVVFEEIERRGIDPGLLEQTAGNNYRARVYPIPANGTRRIVVAYQEDLARGTGAPAYRLALDFKEPLKHFHLAATVEMAGTTPARARTTLPLELPAWQNARLLEVERSDFNARGMLELELPVTDLPRGITERRGESEYFYIEVPQPSTRPAARPVPPMVGLLWDASGSGRERDHAREFALLDAWFTAVPNVQVRLVLLRDQAATPVAFAVKKGDWSALRRELEAVVYDGATSFDGVTDLPGVGEWLLFSDGLVNYGTTRATDRLPLRGAVHAVLAGARGNPAFLRGLALRQAGEFVNLLDTTPAAAATRLRSQALRVLDVERNPEQVAEIFPEVNTPVTEGALVVTGLLRVPAATVRLRIGHDDTDARTVELTLRSGENPSHLAARAWAAAKIAFLATDAAANREDIRRTSEEFGIVTADTSLIVLETLQDYLRYDIAPPEELRAEWDAHRAQVADVRRKDEHMHLDAVVRAFTERVQWWERKFSKDQPLILEKGKDGRERDEVQTRVGSARMLAVPSPAPAASFQASAASVAPQDTEVVTLSAFAVAASPDQGYHASSTLAGTRVRTELFDVASNATGAGGKAASAAGEPADAGMTAAIALQRWEPKAGYLDHLRRAKKGELYSIYLEERPGHLRQPGFYLDMAGFFLEAKETGLGLRILSNLAELELEDAALLRVLAHRLVEAGRSDLARPLFERVLALRPEEPQSRRDLALACAAVKKYQRAVDLLWEVVDRSWDARFPGIELIALGELNAIVATCGEKLDLARVDARLRQNLPVGLRVILTWDADNCDIDLWVDDPNGEKTYYGAPLSHQGGRMSQDFTGGYGPEEFLLREPKSGRYQVRINYFGDRRQTALGPVTAQVRLITGFGTPAEKEQRLTVRLEDNKETIDIGSIEIGGK